MAIKKSDNMPTEETHKETPSNNVCQKHIQQMIKQKASIYFLRSNTANIT